MGPWSFLSNLLVLQQSHTDIPEHCHEFTHCAFWVHMCWRVLEEVIRDMALKNGEVKEVKIEAKGNGPFKLGKARIIMDLSALLKSGIIFDLGDRKLWVDFKY